MPRHLKVYWTYHNPIIYFAFKLPNHIFQFIIPFINEQSSNKKINYNPNNKITKTFNSIYICICAWI